MADRSSFAGAALIMLLAAVLSPATSRRAPPQRAAAAPAAAPAPATQKKGADSAGWGSACSLLWAYYGANDPPGAKARAGSHCPTFPPVHATAMLALLPDPKGSHLDWLYDSGMESIRRAYERAGYTLERYWLPWPSGGGKSDGGANASWQRPGVLLFRRGAAIGCDTIRVVFVVGETPTQGIYKVAFARALSERDSLVRQSAATVPASACRNSALVPRGGDAERKPDSLRIIGPTFSGSSVSLRRELDLWHERHPTGNIRIVTGAANAASNWGLLTDRAKGIAFTATVNRVDVILGALQQVLDSLDICPREVAYLRESTTPFGQAAGNALSDTGGKSSTGEDCHDRKFNGIDEVPPLQIPFPLNISSLRTESAKQAQASAAGQPGQYDAPQTTFDLADSGSVRETPQVMSDLTAPMVELALNDIIATLTMHRVKVVVIIATDVRDRLFLASQVKRRLPDVTTVLVGANALYLRPELTSDLRGALVVTSYPLVLETQFWDRTQKRDRQRFPFASDLAEGIFNATLLQLGDSLDMLDYGYPAPKDTTRPRTDSTTRPPIWVTMIGRSSFLPVTAIPVRLRDTVRGAAFAVTEPADSSYADSARAAAKRLPIPHLDTPYVYARALADTDFRARTEPPTRGVADWALLLVIAAVTVGCLLVLADRSREWEPARKYQENAAKDHASLDADSKLAIEHWRRVRGKLVLDRESWVFFRFSAIFGALAPVGLLMFHARTHGRAPDAGTTWVAGGLGLLTVIAFVYFLRNAVRRAWEISGVEKARGWVGLLRSGGLVFVGVLYFALMAIFVGQVLTIPGGQAGIFFVRALQFGSGVTPLLPLFLGGLVLSGAAVWNLSRVHQLSALSAFEAGWIQQSLSTREGDSRAALAKAVAGVRQRLSAVSPGTWQQVTLILLLIVGLVLAWQKQPSVENLALPCGLYASPLSRICDFVSAFDRLLTCLVIAAMILLIWDLMRFWSVWGDLRTCLEIIGTTPIRDAFATLPLSVAKLAQLTTFVPPSEALVMLTLDAAEKERAAEYRKLSCNASSVLGAEPSHEPYAPLRSLDCEFDADRGARSQRIYDEAIEPGGSGDPATPRNARQVVRELAALYFIEYVERIVRQLRILAVFILTTIFLTILLLSSYPFEPESLVKSSFLIVMVLTIGAMLTVLFQRNRNLTLRAIAQMEKDAGTWNVRLVINLLLVLGVPALALLGSTFPEVRSILFSWIQPLLQALSKG